ncbi:DUF58 domain-containing protein [Lysinibacillus sp. KU-BSD001]|uniref:DUF58 domain-containing protein n=1 Tax=Lysinibacillus sp. KU-BSD001 TaxID=3141328 RepID=UPI0036EB559B
MTKELLLQSEWQKRIGSSKLATKSKLRGQHKGSHRSNRFGSSMDFSDFREYHAGDDVRQVDWNVYARTEKYFIKRFLDEQEMRVHILLDASKSMVHPEKWLLARQLALALGQLVLQNDDRLSFSVISAQPVIPFRKKGATYKQAFAHTIASLQRPSLKDSFVQHAMKQLAKGQTVLILITDGLEPIAEWEALIQRLPRYAGDIRIIQIETQEEMKPNFTGDVELYDIETDEKLNISVSNQIIQQYINKKAEHEKKFQLLCAKYGVATIQLVAEEGFSSAFFHRLKKANWIM